LKNIISDQSYELLNIVDNKITSLPIWRYTSKPLCY